MRNGTITVAAGADVTIKEGITPTITAPTGSTASVVQDALSAKSSPLAGAVTIGAVERKVFIFNSTATALDAIEGRSADGGVAPIEALAAEFIFDEDGNLVINEDEVPTASGVDSAIVAAVMAPKPPAYKRFSQVISAVETALEKAGRGGVITFTQDGTGKLRVFTSSPATADEVDDELGATNAAETAALGNAGAPLAIVSITAGTVSSTRLPGE